MSLYSTFYKSVRMFHVKHEIKKSLTISCEGPSITIYLIIQASLLAIPFQTSLQNYMLQQ